MRSSVFITLFTSSLMAEGKTEPKQIHIALAGADAAGHPTGMNVAWYTAENASSVVAFGLTPDALTRNASGALAVQYLEKHGYHHNVRVVGLEPATLYHYKVGSDTDGWSAQHSFTTAPQAADADGASYQVALFGDMGYLDSSQRPMVIATAGLVKHWSATVSRVRLEALKDAGDLDWVWHLGDIGNPSHSPDPDLGPHPNPHPGPDPDSAPAPIGYVDDAFAHHPLGFYYEVRARPAPALRPHRPESPSFTH